VIIPLTVFLLFTIVWFVYRWKFLSKLFFLWKFLSSSFIICVKKKVY